MTNEELLATLSKALPKKQAAGLAGSLPPETAEKVAPAMATLPDPIPLSYMTTNDSTVVIDKTLGSPLDVPKLSQSIVAAIEVDGELVPVASVLAVDVHSTDDTIKDAVEKADDTAGKLNLMSNIVPWGLGVLGAVLIAAGLLRRKPRDAADPVAEPVDESV